MPRSLDNQLSYSGGELSPWMDARVDHPKYSSGCRQLQNMIALNQGGCTRRPGTIFKAKAKFQNTDIYQYATRLMPFQFSPTTSFTLEFGHNYIRFYSNQKRVTINSAPLWAAGFGYAIGTFVEDPFDADNIYMCIQQPSGPPLAIPPSSSPAYWVKQTIYEIPTPFNARVAYGPSIYTTDVWRIVPCQINDDVYLVHPSYPPYKLVRLADTNWTLAPVAFLTPALLDENATGVLLASSATTGATNLVASAPAWVTATYYDIGRSVSQGGSLYTCIIGHTSGVFAAQLAAGYWHLETIFTIDNVGGTFEIGILRDTQSVTQNITGTGISAQIEATGVCEFDSFGTWAGTVDLERSDDGGGTWYKVATINSVSDHNGSIPVNVSGSALFRVNVSAYTSSTGTPRAVFAILDAVSYGIVRIDGVTDAYHATGTVLSRVFSTAATVLWSEGAWSVRRGYPQAITAFQQRMIYGGSAYEPQRIWGTQTDDLENFSLGNQTLTSDGLAFDLAAVGRGRIQWLIGQVDLFVGFAGAEWVVNAGQGSFGGSNEPITPTQINAGEHSSFGSAEGIPPAIIGNNVLYTQRSARSLQQMSFSVYTNKYMSNDLTNLSEHLFLTGVAQIGYQPQFRNQSILWCVTTAGALCGMTYDAEMQVYAWHRHISGYDATASSIQYFESVSVIDGQGGQDDEVWVVVDRPSGRCIELMNPNNWEATGVPIKGIAQPDLTQAIYVDGAITVTSPVSATITGLDHLEGLNVIGLLNGNQIFGPYAVTGGAITVDGWVPVVSDIVQVGLPIDYAAQGMRLDVDGRAGIIIGVQKALSKVFLRVYNSLSGKVQGNGLKQIPINYKMQALAVTSGPALFTGEREVIPEGTQTDDPIMIVRGNDPLPLTLLATTVRIGITGSA